MEIGWTAKAIKDLAQIEKYIARDKPEAARSVAEHILASVEHLADFPALGRPGRRQGTRNLIVPPYVISYRARIARIEILTIWHGRRRLI